MGRSSSFLVLVAFVALAPLVAAQSSGALTEIRILDENGRELRIAPADEPVIVATVVENTGSNEIEGPITVELAIDSVDGPEDEDATVRSPGSLPAGESRELRYDWSPTNRRIGDYRITATLTEPASNAGLVTTFEVAEDGVRAGNILERAAQYYWFFGFFFFAILLFVVVITARRA